MAPLRTINDGLVWIPLEDEAEARAQGEYPENSDWQNSLIHWSKLTDIGHIRYSVR